MSKKKPKIEEVTRDFGQAHTKQAEAESQMKKLRKLFFDLIVIPESELATQVIYYEGNDPDQHVASLYPKWRIIKKEVTHIDGEWRILIQEDPEKKTFVYQNTLDGKVYQRTVVESAPQVDLARLEQECPVVYQSVTFQPDPPPRELRPLDELDDDHKEVIKDYLLPPKLTARMEKPRLPKDDE